MAPANAVILSAGQGRRLAPVTETKPKCLIPVSGTPILGWQLRALIACGVRRITVVTGFEAASVETAVRAMGCEAEVECLVNPFYSVADNIGSCWAARDRFGDDTLLLNGDTLFCPRVLERLIAEDGRDVTLAIDRKDAYDADDMKVRAEGRALRAVGKTLEGPVDGESIGLMRLRGRGGRLFVDEMAEMLEDAASLRLWYLSVIDRLARRDLVGIAPIDGLPWCEIDFPRDLPVAESRVAAFRWPEGQARQASAL